MRSKARTYSTKFPKHGKMSCKSSKMSSFFPVAEAYSLICPYLPAKISVWFPYFINICKSGSLSLVFVIKLGVKYDLGLFSRTTEDR